MATVAEHIYPGIQIACARAGAFFVGQKVSDRGWKYTSAHDVEQHPAGLLYGTWSCILGLSLIGQTGEWNEDQKQEAVTQLLRHRQADGSFLAMGLEQARTSKSVEYLKLHCTNYALGALLELVPGFDFGCGLLDRFLDADTMDCWLSGRSLQRPWEEGNNIVNVAGYLALCDQAGVPGARDRLYQMLEWHRRNQNPRTGGFDCFQDPSRNQRLQSLAGAVHNFHLHHYLGEPLRCEQGIADALAVFLFMGRLTACLSLDFVELGLRTLPYASDPDLLSAALLNHTAALLNSQRADGGWLESDEDRSRTTAAGFVEATPSSCSYATWFRLASLGMISICLLGKPPSHWHFRKTLGMGYAPQHWPVASSELMSGANPVRDRIRSLRYRLPQQIRATLLRYGKVLVS